MTSPTLSQSLIHTLDPGRSWGNAIRKVARHFHWVQGTEKIADIADALAEQSAIMVLGITDDKGQALGLITRVNLFNLLGKPFGREILGKRAIHEILEYPGDFQAEENIFAVAEKIQPDAARSSLKYYLLKEIDGRFAGIFSSLDLLNYLSQITQMDIKLAGSLQLRLVPENLDQTMNHGRIQAFSHYAQGVGGDFYHVRRVDRHQWFVTVCDVAGKGVAASIITSLLWGMIRMHDFKKGFRGLLRHLNEALIQTFHLEKHVTGVFLMIDEDKKELVWSDLGHGLAFIRRGQRCLPLQGANGNLPLGLEQDLTPHLYKTTYRPGDQLLLLTDGLPEQTNAAGAEFGQDKILEKFAAGGADLPDRLWQAFNDHRQGAPLMDDTTVVLVSL